MTASNMKAKDTLQALYREVDDKFCQQFGFKIRDATFTNVANYMYAPKDPSSLAVTRILFGLAMLFDIPDERGGSDMMKLWGNPKICHFPLIPILTSVGMPYMALVYAALWVGALCIMLGYKFHVAAPMFTICYWYLFLIEKTLWNNHSYLFGLVALLLSCTKANRYWSLDTYLDPSKKKSTVPYWNYFILKYQFFILYFMAGCKKNSPEWLTGYSQQKLSEHWVFGPFKLFLTVPQTDYLVVHWFACVFDQTVALWMMCSSTRHVAMVFCTMFHLMNSRLYSICLFPWVCLATMPLFCPFNWPKTLASYTKENFSKLKYCLCKKIKKNIEEPSCGCKTNDSTDQVNQTDGNVDIIEKADQESKENAKNDDKSEIAKQYVEVINKHKIVEESEQCAMNETELPETINNNLTKDDNKRNVTVYLIMLYVFIQAFLPYSHFITKGYNNWTNGIYGYSWDMMINTWSTITTDVIVVDNDRNKNMRIDPGMYTVTRRWSKHGDMILQYAHCLKNNLDTSTEAKWSDPSKVLTTNISIYVDIWRSLNERFYQRMFDPKVDILKVTWSPFRKVPFLMPLLDETGDWRNYMDKIRSDVHSWSENSDVEFFADFPGYEHKKYISSKRQNVTLTVLQGVVVVTLEVTDNQYGHSVKLTKGNRITVFPRMFNKVLNIGEEPAIYMYTFYKKKSRISDLSITNCELPVFKELFKIFKYKIKFGKLVISNIFQMFKFSQSTS